MIIKYHTSGSNPWTEVMTSIQIVSGDEESAFSPVLYLGYKYSNVRVRHVVGF